MSKNIFDFCFKNDNNEEINQFFSFDWRKEFLVERKLTLINRNYVLS